MIKYFILFNASVTAFMYIINKLYLHKFTGKFNPDEEALSAALCNASDDDMRRLIKVAATDKFWEMWLWIFISEIVYMLVV